MKAKTLLCALLALAGMRLQAQYRVRVDAAAPRVTVSPSLYGIFFEEINHSGEGGLYAEMVLNRDFEITNLPDGAAWAGNLLRTRSGWHERKWFGNALEGWKLVAEAAARGAIRLEAENGLNRSNPHSLRFTVHRTGARIGVANRGFWGMSFESGKWYDLTFYSRTEASDEFELGVSLQSASGREEYARATVSRVGGAWKQYRCSLKASQTDSNGRLLITVNRPGTVWLDVVSLFPRETFKNRPNGMRPDIARMLAGLKPAFLRFPGGAVAGGLNLDNRFQWKNSIGPIEQRKGTMNLWGYYSTNGLGFHEYLQLAEDLQAEALYVCNPGFSDNYRIAEHAPQQDIPAFVAEALDALEYALGPAESKWGSERARNGHPAPFPLRYIEIGNEASGPQYAVNYRLFYDAIHARYPDLIVISNQRKIAAPVQMVDDHKYGSPESFFSGVSRYDSADRSGPPVYVGEYGSNREVGEGNLMAALSEAAYLIGLERNSDFVRMASYAPLLFNVNDIAWPVNLIGFDSSRVFGRTSYYVQKLFAWNRPDEVLETKLEPGSPPGGAELFALAGYSKARKEAVLKFVNRTGSAKSVSVVLRGFDAVGGNAKLTTLANGDPTAENSVAEPDAVVPVESAAAVSGPEWNITLGPYSLTILRLPAQ
jgi:alpha-L-arabinofuranosidase